jgi:serine/threonine protein kinase
MLVMEMANIDLRKYLQLTKHQLTWKERVKITYDIIVALLTIHLENAIHRDLHPGNILYIKSDQKWNISDLGFCGPVNKLPGSIYGILPYIAPEVITKNITTKETDIYSIGILMWVVSSGEPPFSNCKYDYSLVMNIINGIRPKIVL